MAGVGEDEQVPRIELGRHASDGGRDRRRRGLAGQEHRRGEPTSGGDPVHVLRIGLAREQRAVPALVVAGIDRIEADVQPESLCLCLGHVDRSTFNEGWP